MGVTECGVTPPDEKNLTPIKKTQKEQDSIMANEFVELIPRQAERYGNREALRYKDYETSEWTSLSWTDFKNNIEQESFALFKFGLEEQGKIAIFTQNCPEILITHFAAFYNRAIPVPIYATSSKDEAQYIINDSGAKVIFTGDQRQYDIAQELLKECEDLKLIVTLDPTVVHDKNDHTSLTWLEFLATGDPTHEEAKAIINERKGAGLPSDIMYLIYTSGTTGVPKGVMLTHSNFNAAMLAHSMRFTDLDDENDISLSFLPFSHVFELGWAMVCLNHGIRVAINLNPKDIQRAVKEVQPTCMCSVPRFWEKVYTAINDNVAKAKPLVRILFKEAVSCGTKRNLKYKRAGKKVPILLEKEYQYFDKKVFKKLRAAIGLTNPHLFPTAGAMLSDNITEFLHAIGINIIIGYGLSETTASVSFYGNNWELGTIGEPIPSIKVKIGENNEILCKGPTVMKGYYNKPEETAKAIDKNGWFHTGDCGAITETGQLVMTERLKDLYKTGNGKYIAPQVLETRLAQDIFIEQVAVIGDGKKFVSALIVPSFEQLRAYANKKKIPYSNIEELVNNRDIHKMFEDHINNYQKDLAPYEQIKKFIIMPRLFTMENGELTNTLKIRRPVVLKRYAKLIDAIYNADFKKKD